MIASHPCRARLSGRHILVVDDMGFTQDLIQDILSREGALTLRAMDGRQALDLLCDVGPTQIDAIIMDISMPVMDGLETTRRIRSELGLDSLPIIAYTARSLPQIGRALVEAGFNDYHSKSLDPDDLVETLLRWIELAHPLARGPGLRTAAPAAPVESEWTSPSNELSRTCNGLGVA